MNNVTDIQKLPCVDFISTKTEDMLYSTGKSETTIENLVYSKPIYTLMEYLKIRKLLTSQFPEMRTWTKNTTFLGGVELNGRSGRTLNRIILSIVDDAVMRNKIFGCELVKVDDPIKWQSWVCKRK